MARNKLIADLAPEDRAHLLAHMTNVRLEQGPLVRGARDRTSVYFPETAILATVMALGDGRSVETGTVGYEGAVGVLAALTGEPMDHRVVVSVPGVAVEIDAAVLRAAAEASAPLRRVLMLYCRFVEVQAGHNLGCVAFHDASERLAKWLLTSADRAGADRFVITQAELATMVGVQRTTVNAAATQLQKSGAIQYARGRIQIANRRKLEAAACGCYEEIRAGTSSFPGQDTEVA